MNIHAAVSLFGGGPGSGCQGPNCGRPAGPGGGVPLPLNVNPWVQKPKKDWGSSKFSEKKVGGHFQAGSSIAKIYQTLEAKEGQWHSVSDFRAMFPDLKNIDYRIQILRRRGKLTGKWAIEKSGNQVRMILTQQKEKTEEQVAKDEKAVDRAVQLAKDYAALQKKYPGGIPMAESKALFSDYYQQVGLSSQERLAFEHAVMSWTGSVNSDAAQGWRAVAMKYYGRSPSNERVGSYDNRFKNNKAQEDGEKMEKAALAMKDYAGAYARANGVGTVYRGIAGKVAEEIYDAFKGGAKQVEVPINSLSSWSESLSKARNFSGGYKSMVLKLKVDPENIWGVHDATPWLFSAHKHEREYVVGLRKPTEVFTRNDIECNGC